MEKVGWQGSIWQDRFGSSKLFTPAVCCLIQLLLSVHIYLKVQTPNDGPYGGPSSLTLGTVPVKQRWKTRSGSGAWLSQSSLQLWKSFRMPRGPVEGVIPEFLGAGEDSVPIRKCG